MHRYERAVEIEQHAEGAGLCHPIRNLRPMLSEIDHAFSSNAVMGAGDHFYYSEPVNESRVFREGKPRP